MASNPAPSTGYIANPIYNALVPSEGPKAIPVVCDFSAATSYLIDFRDQIEGGQISVVQTVFVDNSSNADETVIVVQGGNQMLKIPAHSQAYLPVLAQKVARFTITSAGGVVVPTQWLNVPVPSIVWGGLT